MYNLKDDPNLSIKFNKCRAATVLLISKANYPDCTNYARNRIEPNECCGTNFTDVSIIESIKQI